MKTKKLLKINGFSRLLMGMLVVLFLSPLLAVGQGNCKEAVSIDVDTVCDMQKYEFKTSEYWLTFDVSDADNYEVNANEIEGDITAMYVYSGDCKSLTLIGSDTVSAQTSYAAYLDTLIAGTYYIKLLLDDEKGGFEICVKNFTPCFTHDTVCVGDSTHFTNCSIYPTTTWKWYFGDGDSSNVENPSHLYDTAGVYFVTFYANGSWTTDSVYVGATPDIIVVMGSFIDCDSLHWDTILNPQPNCYYLWSYDAINWNDTVWTNPFVIEMPYSDTMIWIVAVDSIAGCRSEATQLDIDPCCGEDNLLWDNITITSNTSVENDTLVINGTVVIEDCEVVLANTMVWFNSFAKIEVTGTGELYLENDSLMICPSMTHMWDGIYILSDSAYIHGGSNYIRDAERAVNIKNCGDYKIHLWEFDNNHRALCVDSCNQNLIDTIHEVYYSKFYCSDTTEMLLPYYNTRSYSGVEVSNVDSIQIGNEMSGAVPTEYTHRNYFENLDYGIRNVNSNLFVFNNAFKDIDQNNPNPPSAYIGVGVYSEASSEKNLVIGKNASSGCWSNTFENCWEGVYAAWNQNVSIVNDTLFNGIDYGFYIRNCRETDIVIDSNKIDSVKYGIHAYNNFDSYGSIAYNNIRGCEYGIYVTNNSQEMDLHIKNNGIIGGYYAISILNTIDTAKVYENYIEFDYSSVPYGITPLGIYGGNSRRVRIEDNYIIYTGSASWKPMGIYTDLCPSTHIECNRLYSHYDGIVCKGNMPNSTLKLNLMYGCKYGMYMNSATIGDQLSDSTQTDNRWVNIGTYKMSGTLNSATDWWYYNSSEYNPSPYSSTLVNFLFTHSTAILPASCSGGAATSTGGGSSSISSLLNTTTTYSDNISENQYYEQVYKYGLYKENTSGIGSASNVSFNAYQSITQSNIDEFYTLQKEIADSDFLTASSTANTITSSNTIEKSLLDVYNIQIAQGKDKRNYLSNTEYNSLMDIADESTLETGYAVFEACGMLGIHPVIEYHMEAKTRSTQIEDEINSAFVFPNPATNSISIAYSFENNIGGIIHIYSLEGKLVVSELLDADNILKQINTSNFDNGMYFYSVFTTKGEFVDTGKFIILR